MAATLSTLADALKVFYIKGQNEQLNMKSVLYSKFAKAQETDVTGKSYTYALHVGRNVTAGSGMSDGGAFPTAGNQGWKAVTVPAQQLGTAISITGQTIRAAKTGLGAFIDGVKSEVDGATSDTIRSMNRQLNGNGDGALAHWTAADDTSGTNVDDNQGFFSPVLDEGAVLTCDLLDASDYIALVGTTMVVTVGARTATNTAITWTTTVSGSADTDVLILAGTTGKEVMGIDGIISASDPSLPTGGLHGLAVASYPYWKAKSFLNSGTLRDLSLELMQKPLTAIDTGSAFSQGDIPFLLSNGGIFNKYVALCVANKIHVNVTKLEGGQTAVDFNGTPLVVDPQCKQATIFYPNPKAMDLLTSSGGLQWADFEDGQQFKMKVGSAGHSDAYNAYLVFYGNFACKARNASAVLGDLNDAG